VICILKDMLEEKTRQCCFIIFGNFRPFSVYSLTETKVVDINFVSERVCCPRRIIAVKQKMLAHNLSGGGGDFGVGC
jgi:hypothetical protein